MDARDRLRLYLEQRRELGESELVLDGMPVDELLSLIGARPGAKSPRTARGSVVGVSAPNPPAVQPARPHGEAAAAADAPAEARSDVAPPPPPSVRFDASTASADWRATLREANVAAPGAAKPAPASPPPPSVEPAAAMPRSDGIIVEPVPSTPYLPAAPSADLPAWLSALGLPAGVSALNATPASATAMSAGIAAASTLDAIAELVAACGLCALHKTARHSVPGAGDPRAELVCVGEAPGANEDEQGLPFVGEAGQLLTKILGAIQLTRESVYMCNVLKHRPPANRDPLPDEVTACQPFLRRQLEIVQPRVILALGRFAAQTLLGTSLSLGKLRGQVHLYRGIPVIVTYHPAALLRNEAWKRPTWDDVKLARRILDAARAHDSARDGTSDLPARDR